MNRLDDAPMQILGQHLAGIGSPPQPDFTSSNSSRTETWAGNSDHPSSFLEAARTHGTNKASLAQASGTEGRASSAAQEEARLAPQDRPDTQDPAQDSHPEVPCTFSTYDVSWEVFMEGTEAAGATWPLVIPQCVIKPNRKSEITNDRTAMFY